MTYFGILKWYKSLTNLERETTRHHSFIIRVLLWICKFISILPLYIRATVEAQASPWSSMKKCKRIDVCKKVLIKVRVFFFSFSRVKASDVISVYVHLVSMHLSGSNARQWRAKSETRPCLHHQKKMRTLRKLQTQIHCWPEVDERKCLTTS